MTPYATNDASLFVARPFRPTVTRLLLLLLLSSIATPSDSFAVLSGDRRASSFRSATTPPAAAAEDSDVDVVGRTVLLLPSEGADETPSWFGARSPVDAPSLAAAAAALAEKIAVFSDGRVRTVVRRVGERDHDDDPSNTADALVVLGVPDDDSDDARVVAELLRARRADDDPRRCSFRLDGDAATDASVGPFDAAGGASSLSRSLPWTAVASAARLCEYMTGLFERRTSDDFVVALMLYFDRYVVTVPWVEHSIDATWEKGPLRNAEEFVGMVTKCGDCVAACLTDENCKACVDALNAVDTRDQVASYRTVVSYESPLLTDFSMCILQRNNVFGCDATIPETKAGPMSTWRGGRALTQDDARGILIGHLNDEDAIEGGKRTDVSWKVACGANVAYDQFPSQNQLFYASENGRFMWYDPVFRVETIDGRNVWAKRHYKVNYGKTPGTFHFSVLDNGVVSKEFWNIVGAAEDLSWVVFHYAGAAAAVGQRYIGGLLCTADGSLPPEKDRDEIWSLFESCGIEPWELFVVDNDAKSPGALEAGEPPLNFYRDKVLKTKEEKKNAQAIA